MTSSAAFHTFAVWQSMNLFRRPCVRLINTTTICCSMAVSVRVFQYLEICTVSIIFAKRGLMAHNLLISASLPLWSLWLFPISMLTSSPNCWSRSWASQDLVRPFPLRLIMNAPKASWMACAIHGMWFHNAGYSIPEAWRVDCNLRVIE